MAELAKRVVPTSTIPGSSDTIVDVPPVEGAHATKLPDRQFCGCAGDYVAIAPRSLVSLSNNASTEMPCLRASAVRLHARLRCSWNCLCLRVP
jgi:hypothetical protein